MLNRKNSLWLLFLLAWLGLAALPAPAQVKSANNAASAETNNTKSYQAEVIKVVDGDTLRIRRPGATRMETLRLIGIDAPEASNREQEGQEPFGTKAQQFMSVAMTRKIVRIEQDVQPSNELGEQLGYVWVGDRLMNEEIVKAGLAVLATAPPNVTYVERLQKAQSNARTAGLGVWNPSAPLAQSPSEFRNSKREAVATQGEKESELEIPEFQEGCIVANRKTKIYHLPDGRYYKQAKESKNRALFKTPEDAEKAGYRRASR